MTTSTWLPCTAPGCGAGLLVGTLNCPSCGQDQVPRNDNPDITNPQHYKDHPSGVECIRITEHMNFCLGNAMKYIWRAGLKDSREADLRKAIWYLKRELGRSADK